MDRLTSTSFFMLARQNAEHSTQSLQSEYPRFAEKIYALCQRLNEQIERDEEQ